MAAVCQSLLNAYGQGRITEWNSAYEQQRPVSAGYSAGMQAFASAPAGIKRRRVGGNDCDMRTWYID